MTPGTITVSVELRAFTQPPGYPTERPVKVPLNDWLAASTAERLGLVFYYGQNDHQPSRTCYSVSMGDVIRLPGGQRYRVAGVGFERLPDERRD